MIDDKQEFVVGGVLAGGVGSRLVAPLLGLVPLSLLVFEVLPALVQHGPLLIGCCQLPLPLLLLLLAWGRR
jgi:hypothetical protein